MAFKFVVDQIVKGRAYPALTTWRARPYTTAWRQFGQHWPWTTPLRIEEYCRQHQYPLELYTLDAFPNGCWYPICLGFFDFEIDYMDLISDACRSALIMKKMRLLFMYHEGDNPLRIQQRLDHLCVLHSLDVDCYRIISANTSASRLPRAICFHDFELWYHQRNIDVAASAISVDRDKEFLCLNRVHKSWRAAVMADLESTGMLSDSLWSYCAVDINNDLDENPIQIDLIPQLRYRMTRFLQAAPFYTDELDDAQRNDHSIMPGNLFARTYGNIVIESQFDVDQSGGVFLTEKTFKPIKHGQLFFLVAAAGSLAVLRRLGYHVFDHVLDNSYDSVEDSTLRWIAVRDAVKAARQQGLRNIYQQCIDDIKHNQQLFLRSPWQRLNNLELALDQS